MTHDKLLELQSFMIKQNEANMSKMGDHLREFHGCEDGQFFSELEGDMTKKASLPPDHIFVWTPSFFTGMACLSYEKTNDLNILKWLNQFHDVYHRKVFVTPMDTMHDLGFLYVPYAIAMYKLTNDQNMKRLGLKAADELARRYYPKGNYIRAWGRVDEVIPEYVDEELAKDHFFTESKGLAIVDCMMNLPLLYWASEATGIPYYSNIANAHADMTMKYFVREDDSVAHAYRFEEETGEPIGITNFCGYSDDSYWARGATWAIYGYVIAYNHTDNREYLELSVRLAKKYISELDESLIPVWDFRLPKDKSLNRDTSAAAISACAFIELAKHDNSVDWISYADRILESLSDKTYIDDDISVSGVLRGSNGCNHYWVCGDYYFMEAIFKRLKSTIGYW